MIKKKREKWLTSRTIFIIVCMTNSVAVPSSSGQTLTVVFEDVCAALEGDSFA